MYTCIHKNFLQIGSFAELDKLTTDNKDKLIVVDYSTTWCGPCKMILPKFEALAEEYADAIFVKVGLVGWWVVSRNRLITIRGSGV